MTTKREYCTGVLLAWVLWAEYNAPTGSQQEPVSGYDTRAECMRGMRQHIDGLNINPGKTKGEISNDVGTVWYGLKGDHWAQFRCLPDTIDPRSPSGKPQRIH
jgi:hypothetical protein